MIPAGICNMKLLILVDGCRSDLTEQGKWNSNWSVVVEWSWAGNEEEEGARQTAVLPPASYNQPIGQCLFSSWLGKFDWTQKASWKALQLLLLFFIQNLIFDFLITLVSKQVLFNRFQKSISKPAAPAMSQATCHAHGLWEIVPHIQVGGKASAFECPIPEQLLIWF